MRTILDKYRADVINSELIKTMKILFYRYSSWQWRIGTYSTEFLNPEISSKIPPHKISIKVGIPIIILRNLNSRRLCNGILLHVTHKTVIEVEILTGCAKGKKNIFIINFIIPQRFSS